VLFLSSLESVFHNFICAGWYILLQRKVRVARSQVLLNIQSKGTCHAVSRFLVLSSRILNPSPVGKTTQSPLLIFLPKHCSKIKCYVAVMLICSIQASFNYLSRQCHRVLTYAGDMTVVYLGVSGYLSPRRGASSGC